MKSLYQYIAEGGAAGHMLHPYDYNEFTLRDIKGLIRNLFSAKIEDITEKIDGTNIQATMNTAGQVVFIRNKGNLNSTIGGMTIDDMAAKWKDKPNIAKTFLTAGGIITKVFSKIGPKFFNPDDETRLVVNCECVIAGKTNIMVYDSDQVYFHNIWIYKKQDGEWVNIDITKKGLDIINNACEKLDSAQVTPNVFIKITEKSKEILVDYIKEIDKIFKNEHCSEFSTILDYKKSRFDKYLHDNHLDWIADNTIVKDVLFNRWFCADKLINIKKIKDEVKEYSSELSALDKKGYKDIVAFAIEPIDIFFIKLGNEVISLCDNLMNNKNKNCVIKELQKDMQDAIDTVEADKKDRVLAQLQRMQDMQINATEGIVFYYKGQLMKLTGTFAPLNQIVELKYK
jgi:hypothetical protein